MGRLAFHRMDSFESWRATAKNYRHRGHDVFFRDDAGAGDGVLVCLHGFPTASWDWSPIHADLLTRFDRVIAPDLIGFGWSAKPRDYTYSIHDQADLVEGLLAERGVTQAHFLVHDYSVSIMQELLARQSEAVAGERSRVEIGSAVFLNGGVFPEMHRPRLVQKALNGPFGPIVARLSNERAFARAFAEVFGPDTKPNAEELHRFWTLIAHDGGQKIGHKLIRYIDNRKLFRDRWVDALTATEVPIRLIDGLEDPVSGAHLVARYRELIVDADVVELPGIGHYPQVEAPAAVVAAFGEFHDTRVGRPG